MTMKRINITLGIACIGVFLSLTNMNAQDFRDLDASPHDIVYFRTNKISPPKIKVLYGRPKKNGREIFGNVIPFGRIWRVGANEATEVVFYNTGSEYDPSFLALGVQASKFGGMPVYIDSPAVLLSKADTLQLTVAQALGLQGIIDKARQDAAALLTEAQIASISPIRAEPVVLNRVAPDIPYSSCGSCGPACS